MDRLLPMADPHFEKDENNNTRHPLKSEKTAKFIIISNCGFPEENNFEVLSHVFQRVARNAHAKIIAEIYKAQGPLLSNPDPNLIPIIDEYKKNLKKPFLDPDFYSQLVHKYFDENIKNLDKNKKA